MAIRTKGRINYDTRRRGRELGNRAVAELDLDSLLQVPTSTTPSGAAKKGGIEYISVAAIAADPRQPRRDFKGLGDLVESINVHGVLQPVLVTPIPTWDKRRPQVHTIIVGERRWRAAQEAGIEFVPAVVRDVDEKTALELQITENTQRKELDVKEFAAACERLMTEFNLTLRELQKRIGVSISYISTAVRVSKDPILQKAVEVGNITYTQAQEMVALENRAKMKLVREVTKDRAGGREPSQKEVRARVQQIQPPNPNKAKPVLSQNGRRHDPYMPRAVEPLASRLRQGLVHVRYAADVAEGGHAKPSEFAEALQVAEQIENELSRLRAAVAPKQRRRSA